MASFQGNTGLVSPVNPAPSGTVSLPYIGGGFSFGVRVKATLKKSDNSRNRMVRAGNPRRAGPPPAPVWDN